MNYDEIIKHLQTLAEIPLNQEDENWARIVPLMFAYAENRIYRELDFLPTTTKTTAYLTKGDHQLLLPATVLVLRQMQIQVPYGYAWETKVERRTLERISPEQMSMEWPQLELPLGIVQVPRKFTIVGETSPGPPQMLFQLVLVAPVPSANFAVDLLGVIRPEPLSPLNTETYLSILYPELLCAACMVFVSGYQRDFGAMADDPAKAQSWEGQYTTLRQGALLESARTKGEAAGWTSLPPAPVSQPRAP